MGDRGTSIERRFRGVWQLVSCDAVRAGGSIVPIYGKNPIGRLYYDGAGNMSVHIMRAGRPGIKGGTKFRAGEDEMRVAYEGYEAYFSTCEVDPELHMIRHDVIGSLFPNWTGTTQVRYYAFEGDDRLILSTAPIGASGSGATVVTLVWERLWAR